MPIQGNRKSTESRRLRTKTSDKSETIYSYASRYGSCAVPFVYQNMKCFLTISNKGRVKLSVGTSDQSLTKVEAINRDILQHFEAAWGKVSNVEMSTISAYTNLFDPNHSLRVSFFVSLASFPVKDALDAYEKLSPNLHKSLEIEQVTLCEGNLSCVGSRQRTYRKRAKRHQQLDVFDGTEKQILNFASYLEAQFPEYEVDIKTSAEDYIDQNKQIRINIRPKRTFRVEYKRASFIIYRYGHVEIRGLNREVDIRDARDEFLDRFPIPNTKDKRISNRSLGSQSTRQRGSPSSSRITPLPSSIRQKKKASCGRAKSPPCAAGYTERMNPKGVPCCYKGNPKPKQTRASTTTKRKGCGRAKVPPCTEGYEERTNPSGTRCCYKTKGGASTSNKPGPNERPKCGKAKVPPCPSGYEERTNPKGIRCCYKLRNPLPHIPSVNAQNVRGGEKEINVPTRIKEVRDLYPLWGEQKYAFYFLLERNHLDTLWKRYKQREEEERISISRFSKDEAKVMLEIRVLNVVNEPLSQRVSTLIRRHFEGRIRLYLEIGFDRPPTNDEARYIQWGI